MFSFFKKGTKEDCDKKTDVVDLPDPPQLWLDLNNKFKAGDKITYLGLEMLITWVVPVQSNIMVNPFGTFLLYEPDHFVRANYVDKSGIIRTKKFSASESSSLLVSHGGVYAARP